MPCPRVVLDPLRGEPKPAVGCQGHRVRRGREGGDRSRTPAAVNVWTVRMGVDRRRPSRSPSQLPESETPIGITRHAGGPLGWWVLAVPARAAPTSRRTRWSCRCVASRGDQTGNKANAPRKKGWDPPVGVHDHPLLVKAVRRGNGCADHQVADHRVDAAPYDKQRGAEPTHQAPEPEEPLPFPPRAAAATNASLAMAIRRGLGSSTETRLSPARRSPRGHRTRSPQRYESAILTL